MCCPELGCCCGCPSMCVHKLGTCTHTQQQQWVLDSSTAAGWQSTTARLHANIVSAGCLLTPPQLQFICAKLIVGLHNYHANLSDKLSEQHHSVKGRDPLMPSNLPAPLVNTPPHQLHVSPRLAGSSAVCIPHRCPVCPECQLNSPGQHCTHVILAGFGHHQMRQLLHQPQQASHTAKLTGDGKHVIACWRNSVGIGTSHNQMMYWCAPACHGVELLIKYDTCRSSFVATPSFSKCSASCASNLAVRPTTASLRPARSAANALSASDTAAAVPRPTLRVSSMSETLRAARSFA